MGFVVEQHLMLNEYENITKKQQAVVYGKVASMWKVLIKERHNGFKCSLFLDIVLKNTWFVCLTSVI